MYFNRPRTEEFRLLKYDDFFKKYSVLRLSAQKAREAEDLIVLTELSGRFGSKEVVLKRRPEDGKKSRTIVRIAPVSIKAGNIILYILCSYSRGINPLSNIVSQESNGIYAKSC